MPYGGSRSSAEHFCEVLKGRRIKSKPREGHTFFEVDYTLTPGEYVYFTCDASYPNYNSNPDDVQWPYVYFDVETSLTNDLILKQWEVRNPTPGPFNTPFNTAWENLLFPELEMYSGIAALGVSNSTSCLSRMELEEFQAYCGVCIGRNEAIIHGPYMIDWSCDGIYIDDILF